MSLIDAGIEWFNNHRVVTLEAVTIQTASITRKCKATVIEPETNVSADGVRVKTDKYVFLINAIYLTDIDVIRGIRLTRTTKEPTIVYEAVIDRQMLEEFNDPNNTVKAISSKRKSA